MPAPSRNPPPRTAAAKAALANFYCDLCGKGYARMNEWEAHEGSYDHQHKKRLKEMKQMQKDPSANERARRNEEKSTGLISIKLGASATSTPSEQKIEAKGVGKGFKKAGFKSAFGGGAVSVPMPTMTMKKETEEMDEVKILESESDDDTYDPRFPTECPQTCPGRVDM